MTDATEPTLAGLRNAFGHSVEAVPVVDHAKMGRRVHGIDLAEPLTTQQARALIAALDEWQIVSLPGQHEMTVHDLERMANHFGAPIPHPSNIDDYLGGSIRLKPVEHRPSTQVNAAFP